MEMIAISAARWAVGKALGPVSDGLLESWAASSKLAPNISALKRQLLYAQWMLNNARGRDICKPSLGQLLQDLRNQAYDADDVLEELEYFRFQDALDGTYETTDADARGLVGGIVLNARHTARAIVSKLKLPSCSCASVVCQHRTKPKLKFDRVAMSKRMVEIVDQLKPVCDMVSTIFFLESQGTVASTSTTAQQGTAFIQTTRTMTPQIIEPKLYGRDKLKKDVVAGIVSKYRASDLTVLSIVGPGGLGKTTLTQQIYEEVKSNFQASVWVCVSQNFSASRLAQEIVKQIPKLDNEKGNESAEDLIQKRLKSKRFLIVFDDMWTYHEDEWKKLLAPFKKVQTEGNMVIVTTRNPKVAQMVTTLGCPIRLERLSDEECMRFFQECVFGDQQIWEGHTDLHDIGCEIVKRLKGFPLAVKTIGRLLKAELNIEHWRRVFESKEWEYQASEYDIMPALKLSYNYLPYHLQQCFSHCALFPEDYEFGREELIHLWIGLGLLGADDQNTRIEDTGLGYLSDLVSHGFFQEEKKEDGHTNYVIHDLLHDLARNVSAHECLSIQWSNLFTIQIPESLRHMSIIINNADVQDKRSFENHKGGLDTFGKTLKAGNLRTLMLFGDHHGSFCKIFSDMFQEAKALRVIFLSGASYDVEELLPRFSQLVHLRYLRIKGYVSNLSSLFGSISRFYNLLVLDVKECCSFSSASDTEDICASTRNMSNLVKIRHFLVQDDSYHSEVFEVGKLKSIQELRSFEVRREKHGFELTQLWQLLQLQGSLEIHNLEKVEATIEVEETKLVHMHHLNRLLLHWGGSQSNRDPKKEQDILEYLRPHSNLQEVCIRGHGGCTYPDWLCAYHSVKNLECLCLEGVAWKTLPPLLGEFLMVGEEQPSISRQIFQNLKRLELVNIATLKKWSADSPFSQLEVLTVKDCSELTELPFPHMFPILQQIYISDCVKLAAVPPVPWSRSLFKAILWRVGTIIEYIGYNKNEQKMSVEFKKDALDRELWNVLVFSNLSEVKEFEISGCPPVPLHHLQLLNSLESLQIRDCTSVLWPNEAGNDSPFEFPVEQLEISNCGATVKELAQLISYFPNLLTLELRRCDNKQAGGAEEIEAAAGGQLPLPLQLKELLQNQSSLRSLVIRDCPMLLSFSSPPSFDCPFPASLQSLELTGVKDVMLTLAPLTNLTRLVLDDCGGLRSDDLWHLLAQGRLKELVIGGVHNLLDVPEPSRMYEQDLPQHRSRLQVLETDGEAGAIDVPIGVQFSYSLTDLMLYRNNGMEHFTKEQSEALQMFTSLQVLQICWCSRLQSLPEGLSGLPNLKRLEIKFCDSLRSLPRGGLPSSLVELHIWDCSGIRSLPKGALPSSLTELHIISCSAFQSLPKGSLPSSLKILRIHYCPAIRSLHEGSLPWSLQMLDVTGSNKKLQRQCRKLQGTIPIVKFRY